jgi:hypothetical protein
MTASLAVTSAGTLVYISAGVPATYDKAGYEALTYTLIGEVETVPDFGKQYKVITWNPIDNRKTYKRKGSYDEGQIALTMARAASDGGQTLCIAARDSDASYSFKIVTGALYQYFPGQVTSYTSNRGGVDSIFRSTVNVAIDGEVLDTTAP